MNSFTRYRFYWINFGVPLACAAVVFLMFDLTKIDIAFNNLFYDPVTQTFPLDHVLTALVSTVWEDPDRQWSRRLG